MSQGPGTISASFAYEPPAQNEWDTASTKKAKAHNPKKERAKIFSHLKRGVVLKIVSGCLNVWLILKKIVTAPDKIANTTASSVNAATLYTHSSFGLTPTHSTPSSSNANTMPCVVSQSRILLMFFVCGVLSRLSKLLIVLSPTVDFSASSAFDILRRPLAPAICVPVIIKRLIANLAIKVNKVNHMDIKLTETVELKEILSYKEITNKTAPKRSPKHSSGPNQNKTRGSSNG